MRKLTKKGRKQADPSAFSVVYTVVAVVVLSRDCLLIKKGLDKLRKMIYTIANSISKVAHPFPDLDRICDVLKKHINRLSPDGSDATFKYWVVAFESELFHLFGKRNPAPMIRCPFYLTSLFGEYRAGTVWCVLVRFGIATTYPRELIPAFNATMQSNKSWKDFLPWFTVRAYYYATTGWILCTERCYTLSKIFQSWMEAAGGVSTYIQRKVGERAGVDRVKLPSQQLSLNAFRMFMPPPETAFGDDFYFTANIKIWKQTTAGFVVSRLRLFPFHPFDWEGEQCRQPLNLLWPSL
eukprot:TRINITY_DN2008_c0_g1_i2.p1 TRINITY_DN2008_c0_g1~~TRINITY_DN2008_c0_g1_i2.p1  ORF type:complete len:295 (+),score=18.88 TRINITY_DN2008_c0_g1_i2:51-935(+)